jgi:hypothetical protein
MRGYAESLLKILDEMIEQNRVLKEWGKLLPLLRRLEISYYDWRFSLLPPEKAESTRPVEGKPPMGSGKKKEVR